MAMIFKLFVGFFIFLQLQLGSTYIIVCYFTNWAQHRTGIGRFAAKDINPFLCTHLIYAFAEITEDYKIFIKDPKKDSSLKAFNGLKSRNSELKTLLAVGGWNFGSFRFNKMVSTQLTRAIFIQSVITFLRHYQFDGLDLDWAFPGVPGNPPENKHLYSKLIQELKTSFILEATKESKSTLLLSAAVGAGKKTIDNSYEIPKIIKYLDFIGVQTFDFHGPWDNFTGHNSPLYPRKDKRGDSMYLSVDFAIKYYRGKGVPGKKLIVGIATYGRSYNLSTSFSGVGAPITGPAPSAKYTNESGVMSNYEICDFLKGANYFWDEDQKVPYAVKDHIWLGYDNLRSIKVKVDWLKERKYGGVLVWTIDYDDLHGHCQRGSNPVLVYINQLFTASSGKRFALIAAILYVLI
ncbi:acidic mammalian chitinase-like isoform X2 [Leucoraja erinacea]|uniref:acidic mammalian chitinase-like isoform X2 n=1 Tax=Leucoraja erinaceus TaxID=7782 RepID=UPI0024547C8A|nr:acidic mammalian chitinase-like isoform X2 [Leucoraja erinacea]